jgi:hypothetical protein
MLGWQMFLHTIKSSNKLKGKKTQEVEADILATGLRVRVMIFFYFNTDIIKLIFIDRNLMNGNGRVVFSMFIRIFRLIFLLL